MVCSRVTGRVGGAVALEGAEELGERGFAQILPEGRTFERWLTDEPSTRGFILRHNPERLPLQFAITATQL